jgi:hypothetical protein
VQVCARSLSESSAELDKSSSNVIIPGAGVVFSSEGSQTNSRTLVSSALAARATSARPESVASISAPACRSMKAASSARAFADAARGKTRCEAIAHGVEGGVGPRRVAADDGRLVWKALGAPM